MAPCYQRRAKYFYNITEILLLNKEVKNISANIIELIIQDYKDYFATRHEDPILKIYTTKHYN